MPQTLTVLASFGILISWRNWKNVL